MHETPTKLLVGEQAAATLNELERLNAPFPVNGQDLGRVDQRLQAVIVEQASAWQRLVASYWLFECTVRTRRILHSAFSNSVLRTNRQ